MDRSDKKWKSTVYGYVFLKNFTDFWPQETEPDSNADTPKYIGTA